MVSSIDATGTVPDDLNGSSLVEPSLYTPLQHTMSIPIIDAEHCFPAGNLLGEGERRR